MKIRRLQSPFKSCRELTSQEHQLWTEVTKQIVRTNSGASRALQRPHVLKDQGEARNVAKRVQVRSDPHVQWTPVVSNPGASINRKTLRKLRRGVREFDQTLDLHGMTESEAHMRLKDFLVRSQSAGAQLVLVITGRGEGVNSHGFAPKSGVLRKNVPEWLRSYRNLVSGFEEAPPRLGGGGALFVRLKRPAAV